LASWRQREQDGFVGGGVAGMQRGDDIDRAHLRVRDLALHKVHRSKPLSAAIFFRRLDQIGARLHRDHTPATGSAQIKVVENKAEIGFARAQIGQHRLVFFLQCSHRSPASPVAPDAAPV
jgi:hypothetical protein